MTNDIEWEVNKKTTIKLAQRHNVCLIILTKESNKINWNFDICRVNIGMNFSGKCQNNNLFNNFDRKPLPILTEIEIFKDFGK